VAQCERPAASGGDRRRAGTAGPGAAVGRRWHAHRAVPVLPARGAMRLLLELAARHQQARRERAWRCPPVGPGHRASL